MREGENAETRRQAELALAQARYEADHARRQYDAVDPANRLVAAELERRWNDRLAEVHRQEERLAAMAAAGPDALSVEEKDRLMALGVDLERAWSHPGATAETRKRILRAVIAEIVVTLTEDRIGLLIHWHGGKSHPPGGAAQPDRSAPVEQRRRRVRHDPRPRQATGGWRYRRHAEPPGQADRTRQSMDGSPGAQLPPTLWRAGASTRGDGRARRADARGCGAATRCQLDDGAAADQRRHHHGETGLQGSALGDPGEPDHGARPP